MPSTVISAMNYDAETATLKIIFVTGKVYDYKNVPEEVYLALKTSTSKGTYFNQHIRDNYEFEKIR